MSDDHTRPRSVAAGNRHSHATLGIMGNHRKVVLYHNNVDFTATRGQRVKAATVNSKGFMKFGTHTNEESDECQQKWLPLSDFVGLCSKYIAIPYGSMAFILKKPIVPNNPMFLISPVQPWWCQYMTISTLLDICVLTGFARKGFVMRDLDVYLNVRRKNVKQTVEWPIEIW